MKHIRPFGFFEKLKGFAEHEVHYQIPDAPSRETRTVFSLETLLLITVARFMRVRYILEVGTSIGYNAWQLARNTDAYITTIDIKKPRYPAWRLEHNCALKIKSIESDFAKFDSLGYKFNMVFIDGDHSYEAVKRDTAHALDFSPDVIAWHDYGNPTEPGVKKFLDEVYFNPELIHVNDSWLVFWFPHIAMAINPDYLVSESSHSA